MDLNIAYQDIMNLPSLDPTEKILCIRTGAIEPFFSAYIRYYNPHIEIQYTDVQSYLTSERIGLPTVIIISLREIAPALWDYYYSISEEEIQSHIENIKQLLTNLIKKAEHCCAHPVFFLLHDIFPTQICTKERNISDIIFELNLHIRSVVCTTYVISTAEIAAQIGANNFWDHHMLYRFGCPYSKTGCNALAYYTVEALRNISPKKCIICDCDDVLWGGILMEAGYEGIQLSGNFVGRAYRDFQRELVRLVRDGFILCLCSKSEESAVVNVLMNHPDMILRTEHITATRIGSANKVDDIRSFSLELNIALSDMVFIDDSDYEIGLVNLELPEVFCIKLDRKRPYTYSTIIRNQPYLKKGVITMEDQTRTKNYKDMKQRETALQELSDLKKYHEKLKTKLDIHIATPFDIPRIAQLSQRTNQFNLSNSHLDTLSLQTIAEDSNYNVLCLYASDIYGNMGLVGAAVLCFETNKAIIQHFWLSCRVFHREFENSLLTSLKHAAEFRWIHTVEGVYNATEKNKKFSDFYLNNGINLYEKDR